MNSENIQDDDIANITILIEFTKNLKEFLRKNKISKTFYLLRSHVDKKNKIHYNIYETQLNVWLDKNNNIKYQSGYSKTLKSINNDFSTIITYKNKIVDKSFFDKVNFTKFSKMHTAEDLLYFFRTLSTKNNIDNF